MKKHIISALLILGCFYTSMAQNHVKLKYNRFIDLSTVDAFSIGFEYDTRRGKIKKKGSYFEKSNYLQQFEMQIKGGAYDPVSGRIIIHKIASKKNNNSIIIEYSHPKNSNIRVSDTLLIPHLSSLNTKTGIATNHAEIQIELEANFSNGKSKVVSGENIGSFLRENNINVTLQNGAYISNDVIRVQKNGTNPETQYLQVEFSSDYPGFIASIDSLEILDITDLVVTNASFNYGSDNELFAEGTLSNGIKKQFHGSDLQHLLEGYQIKTEVQNGQLSHDGMVKTPPFSEQADTSVTVHFSSPLIAHTSSVPLQIAQSFVNSYNGADGSSSYTQHGNHGEHADHVNISIKEINGSKENYKVTITHRNGNESFYFNPKNGTIRIDAIGGNGSDGKDGKAGTGADATQSATGGESGGDGGDGGFGGDVTVQIPASFKAFLHVIVINNPGGKGGHGGSGGYGGMTQDIAETTLAERLLPDREVSGDDGRNGRQGRNGSVQFIYY